VRQVLRALGTHSRLERSRMRIERACWGARTSWRARARRNAHVRHRLGEVLDDLH
jgi:hypothetical protein